MENRDPVMSLTLRTRIARPTLDVARARHFYEHVVGLPRTA
jgi:hypothetical protein